MLMGFTHEFLGRDFVLPQDVSDAQAYRQFGNSVVVPQFEWVARALMASAGPAVAEWRASARGRVA
jgi:site-specific DNA-cytosine methylase